MLWLKKQKKPQKTRPVDDKSLWQQINQDKVKKCWPETADNQPAKIVLFILIFHLYNKSAI